MTLHSSHFWVTIALAVGTACSAARLEATESGQPTLTLPARFAEGSGDPKDAAASADGAEPQQEPGQPPSETQELSPATPHRHPSAPDPTALSTPLQWEYRLRYRHGDLLVEQVRPLRFDQPVSTARRVGRFAIELWIGRELVDRVRFDFPLLAADAPPHGRRKPLHAPPTLSAGADVTQTVLVPRSERATRAVLVDRATGRELRLPWPPDSPIDPVDAGPPANR